MQIYGLGIVAACYFAGNFIGRILGQLIGIGGNVGGVGLAMLALVIVGAKMQKKGGFSEKTEKGILFLSSIYIPVVVAMAAKQNVVAAIDGGAVAFLAGGVATIGAMALVPLLSKIGSKSESLEKVKGE
ncbi:MAG: malonate transporter subunit MadL [Spirochaetales bacterium]|nr:malonate transporter subunit MadL [Spirochaetales bacterium]